MRVTSHSEDLARHGLWHQQVIYCFVLLVNIICTVLHVVDLHEAITVK